MFYKDNKEYTEREVRELCPNISFSKPFNPSSLGFEVVLPTPKPNVEVLQVAYRSGTTIDSKGNRVEAWAVKDMFEDYTNEEGLVVTKAEQENKYLADKLEIETKAKIQEVTNVIDNFIQSKINDYNKANGTVFSNIEGVYKYTKYQNSIHYNFAVALVRWACDSGGVWETARKIQSDVLSGLRTMPTIDEFVAELPKLKG